VFKISNGTNNNNDDSGDLPQDNVVMPGIKMKTAEPVIEKETKNNDIFSGGLVIKKTQ